MKRIWYFFSIIAPLKIRMNLLKLSGVKIWEKTEISRGYYIDRTDGLVIGEKVFINYGVHFYLGADAKYKIEIQNRVFIGPDVKICIPSHMIGDSEQRAEKNIYDSIYIKRGAWICASVIILGGVTIGEGSIVAAGSVVNKSIPSNELWGGVPARFIKKLD